MDFIDYDVVERQLIYFNTKINHRFEREIFNEKTNTKHILTTLCLDYSPDNNTTSTVPVLNHRKDKIDKNKYPFKIFPIMKLKKDNDNSDGLKKKEQNDSFTLNQIPNKEDLKEIALGVIDIVINNVIEDRNLKEIAQKSAELFNVSHSIKVYLLNTLSFYKIESEQGDTIKDLKVSIIKMIEKDKKIKLSSRQPDDYDVFYYKEDNINESNLIEQNRISHSEKTIDDRLLMRMLKSKVLSIEYRKDNECNMNNNSEESDENTSVKIYYNNIDGFNGNEEFIVNNNKTMSDVLDMVIRKKNLKYKNKDLYYFQIHFNKEIQTIIYLNAYENNIANDVPLHKIKQYAFDLYFMAFPDI